MKIYKYESPKGKSFILANSREEAFKILVAYDLKQNVTSRIKSPDSLYEINTSIPRIFYHNFIS